MSDDHVRATMLSYDRTAREYAFAVKTYAPEPERETFMSLLPARGRILDAGCGSGRDAQVFAERGFSVTGVDISRNLLAFAREHTSRKIRYQRGDIRSLSFLPESFDGIWACASLLHLKRDEIVPVLRNFFRILLSGGILCIIVKEGTGERMAEGSLPGTKRFFTYFSEPELVNAVSMTGYSVLECATWNQQDRHPGRPSAAWIRMFCRKTMSG